MNPDDPITKHVEEFNARLTTVTDRNKQNIARLYAHQTKWYWEAVNGPPTEHQTLQARVRQWLTRRVASMRKQRQEEGGADANEQKHVGEAKYSVITPHAEGAVEIESGKRSVSP